MYLQLIHGSFGTHESASFKMAAVCHLGFLKIRNFESKRVKMHDCAKFCEDRLNHCHPLRVFVGVYHCAEFGCNQC